MKKNTTPQNASHVANMYIETYKHNIIHMKQSRLSVVRFWILFRLLLKQSRIKSFFLFLNVFPELEKCDFRSISFLFVIIYNM